MSAPLLEEKEIEALETSLTQAGDAKAQSDIILQHKKVLEYLASSLDAPVETQMQDIKDDKYKALAHAAYLFQNPPENVDLHNQALEFISAHHDKNMDSFKTGSAEKFTSSPFSLSNFKIASSAKAGVDEKFEEEEEEVEYEHCTCEDGGLRVVESVLKPTVFIPSSLNEQFSGLNLKDTKYLASSDGGLGIYAATHEFKIDTSQ